MTKENQAIQIKQLQSIFEKLEFPNKNITLSYAEDILHPDFINRELKELEVGNANRGGLSKTTDLFCKDEKVF